MKGSDAAWIRWRTGGDQDGAGLERGAATFSGGGPESTWVTGGAEEESWKANLKTEAWRQAYDVPSRKAAPEPDTDPATCRTGFHRTGSRIPA